MDPDIAEMRNASYDVQRGMDYLGQKVESSKGTGSFASTRDRDMYAFIKRIERDIVKQEQARRRAAADAAEKRQMGGEESVVSFVAARSGDKPKLAFGKAVH